jgi:type II secretion system protein N
VVGTAVAGALLTLLFLLWGFPYERLAARLTARLGAATGAQIAFADLGPYLSFAGPGFEAREVEIVTPQGTRFELERLRLRPAWSLAWLRLAPALHVDALGPGRLSGVVTLGDAPAFAGELQQVDLARIPFSLLHPGTSVTGTLDAVVDLARSAPALAGTLELTVTEGSLGVPDRLPLGLAFDELRGSLRLGGDQLVRIDSLQLAGALLSGSATGSVGAASSLEAAPLDLDVELQAAPALRPTLEGAGLRFDREGRARLRVEGTAGAPQLR